ncbi:uncharacterized protein LOC122502233 [Leptopilina heterotoma]|uniref:uncharacterized protein LOC122502233 n=1 Tax=Leptopilina heterotoma TaxID=63436 RepID=UPI001CA899A2|nr:uncharacterized protein LOC122502233 [Leptopilina heterotoma]
MSTLLASQLALVSLIDNFNKKIVGLERGTLTTRIVKGGIELLKNYWTKLQSNHLELVTKERLLDEQYFVDNVFERTEATFTEALGHLYDQREGLSSLHHKSSPASPLTLYNLPRIDLPSFSGDRGDWESFRDMYVALVHSNQSLSAVQKLYYLKSNVQGEAKRALDGIAVTESNNETAWSLMLKRYDNRRLFVQENLSILISIDQLREENATKLQTLLDTLIKKRDSLRTIGRPVEHWDDWFTFLAARAMDPTTRSD